MGMTFDSGGEKRTNRELAAAAQAVADDLGEEINTSGLSKARLVRLLDDLEAKQKARQAMSDETTEAAETETETTKTPAPAPAATPEKPEPPPPVNGDASVRRTGGAPGSERASAPVEPVFEYTVATPLAVAGKILRPGDEITLGMISPKPEVAKQMLERHVAAGRIVARE